MDEEDSLMLVGDIENWPHLFSVFIGQETITRHLRPDHARQGKRTGELFGSHGDIGPGQ